MQARTLDQSATGNDSQSDPEEIQAQQSSDFVAQSPMRKAIEAGGPKRDRLRQPV